MRGPKKKVGLLFQGHSQEGAPVSGNSHMGVGLMQ